jgi:hypothetical protein
MDASASRELWRHTTSNVLIINPHAPAPPSSAGLPSPRTPGNVSALFTGAG